MANVVVVVVVFSVAQFSLTTWRDLRVALEHYETTLLLEAALKSYQLIIATCVTATDKSGSLSAHSSGRDQSVGSCKWPQSQLVTDHTHTHTDCDNLLPICRYK